MSTSRLTVAVAQTSPRLGDVETNVQRAEDIVTSLAASADLVVFPELFTTGYDLEGLDLGRLAERIPDGPTIRRLRRAAAAAKIAIVGSIVEAEAGQLFDTAIVIDRHGELVGRYRKSHLYPAERGYFTAGSSLAVVNVDGLVLGLAICFEHAFPEIFAELALSGAQLVAIPSAVPRGFDYLLELRTRARAQDNQLFVAAANLVGDDGRTVWCGGSLIVDPRGDILASAGPHDETIITANIDLGLIDRERAQEPIWASRRPDLYPTLRFAGRVPPTPPAFRRDLPSSGRADRVASAVGVEASTLHPDSPSSRTESGAQSSAPGRVSDRVPSQRPSGS